MKKSLIALIILIAVYPISAQSLEHKIQSVENNLHLQTFSSDDVSSLGGSIYDKMDEYKIPGVSLAIINNGKIDWAKTYGLIDSRSSGKVETNTLFQCASIGKMISAIAALSLVEAGLISLDEPVNNKLQRWKFAENENTKTQPVTLRHLLSHSSGLTDGYGFLGYGPEDEIPTIIQILNNQAPASGKKSLEIKTIPGTVEKYSGAGYVVIQLLIEDLTNMSFEDYVRKVVLDPLEMKNTTYSRSPDNSLNMEVAQGHVKKGAPIKGRQYNVYPEKAAAGPWTTAVDLALLVIELQKAYHGESHLILKQSTVQEMLNFQINNKGLGANIKGFVSPIAFWHAGQNLGFTALLYGTINSKSGAVILLNADYGEKLMLELMTSISNTYDWPVMKSYKVHSISDEEIAKIKGSYFAKALNKRLFVTEKKGEVFISQSRKGRKYKMNKIGENHYSIKGAQDYFKISFYGDFLAMKYSEGAGKEIDLQKEGY